MKKLFPLFFLCFGASAVKHSLKYFITGTSGITKIPGFVVVAMIDEIQYGYCDDNMEEIEPKQDWVKKLFQKKPEHLKDHSKRCFNNQQLFKAYMGVFKQRLNQTEDRPSVSLLQKTPSSPVSCHATGFYPDRADLFWRKDGEEIHEGVEKGGILPNSDGTFQMSSELNISLIKHEDWRKYDCVFQLYGVKEEIIITLNKTEIQTNWVSPSVFPPVVGGAVGGVLIMVLGGVLYCCWRKINDFQPVRGDLEKEDSSSG